MPLTGHLRELQRRLTRAVLAILVASVVAAFFYEALFDLVTDPFNEIAEDYERRGYENLTLNFQGIGDPFSYALKISAMAGLIAASELTLKKQGTDVRYMDRAAYARWLKQNDDLNRNLAKDLGLLKR